jgi:outer membrane lipoprotein-sorting protein
MKAGTLFKWITIFSSLALITIGNVTIGRTEEMNVDRLISDAVDRFKTVEDYTCRLNKKVRKKGVLHEDPDISVKYKKTGHYYFRWNSGLAKGREVIFVQGKNNDKVVAHPGGVFKWVTLRLDPEGSLAMRKNRHSLKSSGMEKIIALVASNTALARTKGLEVIRFMGEGRFDGKRIWIVEGLFPERQGFYARKIRLYLCPTLKLPLKVSIYDGSGKLVEDYEFHDLKINAGLSETDFEPHNPQYSFMRP